MAEWKNGRMAERQNGSMAEWNGPSRPPYVSDTGRRAVQRFPRYNDIHELRITSYYTFQDAQVGYRH